MQRHQSTQADTRAALCKPFYPLSLVCSLIAACWVLWIRELGRAPSLFQAPPTLGYPNYYRAQAEALLQGHLWVPASALGDECYFLEGRCFGYFGLSPSLIRLLPAIWDVPGDFSPLAILLGYITGVAGALLLLWVIWNWLTPTCHFKDGWFERFVFLSLAVALGPGSVSVFATRPDVADEAILWGSSATIWTTLCVVLWLWRGTTSAVWAGVIVAVLSAGGRPSVLPALVGLGIVGFVIAYRCSPRRIGALVGFMCMAVLPVFATVLVFMAKFGKPVPDLRGNYFIASSPYWQALRSANNDVLFSWIFIPQNAWNFLRPTALHYDLSYPRGIFFRQADSFWPAPVGGSYLEPAGSLTTFAPLLVGLSLCALLPVLWPRIRLRAHYGSALGVAGALSLSVVATWSQVAMTNRYLVDAVPLLVFLSILGGAVLASQLPQKLWLRVAMVVALASLVVFGVTTVVYVMR